MIRAVVCTLFAAVLLAGCGSSQSRERISRARFMEQVLARLPEPLACIAERFPTGTRVLDMPYTAHYGLRPRVSVRWRNDGETLVAIAFRSPSEAGREMRKPVFEEDAEGQLSRVGELERYGSAVIDWSPRAPTSAQRSLVLTCHT
jgi:hypothetical protein